MKVLLTIHQFFPDFSAGTEVLTYSVAKELIGRGHEVRILTGHPEQSTLSEDSCFEEYDYEGIHVYRYNHSYSQAVLHGSRMELDYDNKGAAGFFEKVLNEFRPDIVHFFHLSRLGSGLITKVVEKGIPAFLTPTDFWVICPKARMSYAGGQACLGPSESAGNCAMHLAAQPFGAFAESLVKLVPSVVGDLLVRSVQSVSSSGIRSLNEVRALGKRLPTNIHRLNLLNKLVVPNRTLERLLIRYGVDKRNIVLSAYGIKFDEVIVRKARVTAGAALRVGFIGTLASHKGCHVLLDAFQQLDKGIATLKIFGSESDFPDYSRNLRNSSENNPFIEFCGTFPNSSIGQVLSELDVLVVPSIWAENTPLVIYSAQAAGCPVLASDVPGIAEAIEDDVDGLLFERGNSQALYECLLKLVRAPDILERLSKNTRPPKSVVIYVDELLGIWEEGIRL
ncbi:MULTISPECIES: glycosyltransferase family 4 protein [Pseudomonas]|uniref:glycosyltransferase family 4 protein n=1 Tax=Pseudomonas TaxID=286 RepID=UPI0009BB77B9|nr:MULTISPECIES: glycosyltransferase family 4 protein [Pseudomonas]UUT21634.1 glycosyltransferase family 4 protein [Pseudomonas sp. T8]